MVMVTEYNFRNEAIQWQMSKSTNVIFYILIFAKIRPVWMIVRRARTQPHRDKRGQAMAIGEMLQICLETVYLRYFLFIYMKIKMSLGRIRIRLDYLKFFCGCMLDFCVQQQVNLLLFGDLVV